MLDGANEALVRDDRAVEDIRIHDHIERDGRDVRLAAGRVGRHRTRRRIGRRIDQHAVDERGQAGGIRDRRAVQCRAARNIGRVHRHRVAQHNVHGILIADVLHRDRVAQSLTGEQDVRVAGQVRGDLLHQEGGRRHDRHPRRIFVARDLGIGPAIDVRVIAQREGGAIVEEERRLVGDDGAVGECRDQRDVELDENLAVGRQVQVTDVDDAGAGGAARAAGGADVGTCRESDERERARHECRLCVESV